MLSFLKNLFHRATPIKLNILIYEEDGEWVAHCLQMDIVTTNDSEDSVKEDIIDLIKFHIICAIENDNVGYIFKMAPPEEWEKYLQSQNQNCDVRKIAISLNKGDHRIKPIPLREVEFCFA